jgi:hypothetical protein
MGAFATIIESISDDVIAALAAAGYPPLTPDASGNPGAILVGSEALFEMTAPPRIIFEPIASSFKTAEYGSASVTLATTERRNQKALRTVAAEDCQFTVRCWGADVTGVPVDDYDVTRAIYHQVRASLQKLLPGAFAIEETGKWESASNVNRSGRQFVFGVTIFTPILDALVPYALSNRTAAQIADVVDPLYAPAGVAAVGTETMTTPAGGGPEAGCT